MKNELTDKKLGISYCITCRGRLHHLKQTLPANLAAERDNPNVEFVVLDYGSEDGLGDWIRENFQAEMASGRLRYARHEATHFRMAHAKNMAHRLATHDILCNLDADNTIVKNYSCWIFSEFAKNPHSFIATIAVEFSERLKRYTRKHLLGDTSFQNRNPGTTGRVILHRDDFERMGGYDEQQYNGYGNDDTDMMHRAVAAGLRIVVSPPHYWGNAIDHSDTERLMHMSQEHVRESHMRELAVKAMSPWAKQIAMVRKNYDAKPTRAGWQNTGCGHVVLNFTQPITIAPLGVSKDTKASLANPPEAADKTWGASLASSHRSGVGRS